MERTRVERWANEIGEEEEMVAQALLGRRRGGGDIWALA